MQHPNETAPLNFRNDGAQRFRGAAAHDLTDLIAALEHLPADHAGTRISGIKSLRPFLALEGSIGSIATGALGPASHPVRAILFDKTAERNWSLGWHQDRTICVREKIAVDGFGPWTLGDLIR